MLTEQEIDERNAIRDTRALAAAVRIVETRGLSGLTREAIAAEANLSPASISNFGRTRISNGTHDRLGYRTRILAAMMERAAAEQNVRLLRIGLAEGCLRLTGVPAELREAVQA